MVAVLSKQTSEPAYDKAMLIASAVLPCPFGDGA